LSLSALEFDNYSDAIGMIEANLNRPRLAVPRLGRLKAAAKALTASEIGFCSGHMGLAQWVRAMAGVDNAITATAAGRCSVEGDVMVAARLEAMFSGG